MQVVVIGAGVVGLSAAQRLVEAGHAVRLWSADDPLATTSSVAAAVWYPYRAQPRRRVLGWSQRTNEVFTGLAQRAAAGVRLGAGVEIVADGAPEPWWRDAVRHCRRAQPHELPAGATAGWRIVVPVIEMPRYLRWLADGLASGGVSVERRLVEDPAEATAAADVVVGCLGMGARALLGDSAVTPVRGQVVRVRNPGLESFLIDDREPDRPTYVVPRSVDVVCGGTAQHGRWDTAPEASTARDILARCVALEPALRGADILSQDVGLRPVRPAVRLEVEDVDGVAWVHNYGHGGAGVTLSWGCAEEVVRLVQQLA